MDNQHQLHPWVILIDARELKIRLLLIHARLIHSQLVAVICQVRLVIANDAPAPI